MIDVLEGSNQLITMELINESLVMIYVVPSNGSGSIIAIDQRLFLSEGIEIESDNLAIFMFNKQWSTVQLKEIQFVQGPRHQGLLMQLYLMDLAVQSIEFL